jgi:hypothetical protein
VDGADGLLLPWAELVSFAMDVWSQGAMEEALGSDVTVLPPLPNGTTSIRSRCFNVRAHRERRSRARLQGVQ